MKKFGLRLFNLLLFAHNGGGPEYDDHDTFGRPANRKRKTKYQN